MVIIDHQKCCYCGGCVSACPVEALTLAETILTVNETCIECGDCTFSCPVGALSQPFEKPNTAFKPIRRKYDVIVVGAGPAGSMAALTCARLGLAALLIEKRQEIGSPVRCAEGVSAAELEALVVPQPGWIAAEITRSEIQARRGAELITSGGEGGRGYILERRIFDRWLAESAALAGAEVSVKTAVKELLTEAGFVCGVRIERDGFPKQHVLEEVEAKLVIAADGVESQIGRKAGLDLHLPLKDTMSCAQFLLAGIDVDPACTRYYLDCELAPGGYAWVFPKSSRTANVGLGIQADLWEKKFQEKPGKSYNGTALQRLERFISDHPDLAKGSPVTMIAGIVPVAPPPARLATHGLLIIGDAARQVDPLTGGGIIPAMQAGRLAAETAARAIEAKDLSATSLQSYQTSWEKEQGRKLSRNYRLRQKFPAQQRTDDRFLHAFSLAVAG